MVVRYYAESAPSISILSTPMTHSLPGIFLTFPVPAGPRSPNALLNKVKQHYNRSKGGHVLKDTGPVWPALPALAFYQRFIEIVSASLWEESLPHTRLHSAHIPAVLREEPNAVPLTRMLQWSRKRREEGYAGVNLLCRPGRGLSDQKLKNKQTNKTKT